jgi:TIR domain-containing protein
MADVFIGYEHTDYPRARRIAEALERHGLTVWWDRKLLAGDVFEETIRKALDTARCVIVLWSKASVSSNWVKDEAGSAAKRDIFVPILIDNVEIPLGFRQLHAAALLDWETPGFEATFRDVLDSVLHAVARSDLREVPTTRTSVRTSQGQAPSRGTLLKSHS